MKNVLLIHGGGDGGYEEDAKLAASLQKVLGTSYKVHYPKMAPDESESDFGRGWPKQIGNEISSLHHEVILVGHSLGASMLLKFLSENKIEKNISGIFLISPPFWSGNQDWVKPLKLQKHFADKLPKSAPYFFYQCLDDDVVPPDHLTFYKQNLPWAVFHEIATGGHQLNNDLTIVAQDIKSL